MYVQISKTEVPLTTGPVLFCPSAAFTTAAVGHAGRCVEPDGALVAETPGVEPVVVGLAFSVEDPVVVEEPVVGDVLLLLELQAAKNTEQMTAATAALIDARLALDHPTPEIGLTGRSFRRAGITSWVTGT
jgi:hypothetical protein